MCEHGCSIDAAIIYVVACLYVNTCVYVAAHSGLVQVWFRSGSGLVHVWFRYGSGLVHLYMLSLAQVPRGVAALVALAMAEHRLPPKRCTRPGCGRTWDLAICELCMHWVCREHRMLVGEMGGQATALSPSFISLSVISLL